MSEREPRVRLRDRLRGVKSPFSLPTGGISALIVGLLALACSGVEQHSAPDECREQTPGDLFDQRGYEKFELALKQYQELVERFSFDIPWARVNAAVEVSDELLNDIIGPTHEAKAEYKHEGAESSAVQDDEADEEA